MSDTKVLIVDDEELVRALLSRWLAAWGYRVKEASSADQALTAMTAEPAHIVVCDVRMPDRDGLWLAEQLHAGWPATAIIMATGHHESGIVHKSRTVGAVAYLTKPFDAHLMRQAVDHASGRMRFRPSAER
jgi:two-component system response regulator GlrR